MAYLGGKSVSLLAVRDEVRKGLLRFPCRSALFRELGIDTQQSIACDIMERSGILLGKSQRR
jgi:hypothetical protein